MAGGGDRWQPWLPRWAPYIVKIDLLLRLTGDVAAVRLSGAERDAAWREMLDVWPNYAKSAERTGREIPVFHLTPR